MWSVECEVSHLECGVASVECQVECGVGVCGVWSVKFGVSVVRS